MEQIKKMENERNKRLDDHNKMLEAQKRMLFNQRPEYNTNTNTNVYYEKQIANYEKQIEDKVCLINELLKKIKDLNAELSQYKTSNV
jgi:hypothetical protein